MDLANDSKAGQSASASIGRTADEPWISAKLSGISAVAQSTWPTAS